MNIKKGLLMLALTGVMLLTGCGGTEEAEAPSSDVAVGTQGSQEITVTRGIVSGDMLFVSLDKQVNVRCDVHWEVLQEGVSDADVGLLIEMFRMRLQDEMDGLTTAAAWDDTMESFVEETVQSIAEELTDEDFSVTADILEIERVEDP